jgi:hypothetical protein
MPFPITELLLLAIPVSRFGMFYAVTCPVIRMASSPFSGAVAANIAVLRIRGNLLPMVFGSALSLACQFAADHLARLKLRLLKGLLAIAAAPFRHTAVVASNGIGGPGSDPPLPQVCREYCRVAYRVSANVILANNYKAGRIAGVLNRD